MDKNKIIKIKGHAYCKQCETELTWNEEINQYVYNCNCYDNKNFKYILLWCNDCQEFTSRRGNYKNSSCCKCAVKLQHKTMKKEDPEGYAKRQSNASKKANEKMKSEGKGVWSEEQHIKAEKTKREKGVDLGNQEFRKKIGCNGNPPEIQQKLKEEKRGIYSDKCLELKTQRFNEYWQDKEWIQKDKERKIQIVKNQYDFSYNIDCNEFCDEINECDNKNCIKNIYGWCEIKQKSFGGGKPNFIFLDVLTYKDEPVKDIIQKLNDKIYDIKYFPGWNLRYCTNCQKLEWHYETECLICDNKDKLTNSNFVNFKGIEHVLDHSTNEYVPSDKFFNDFNNKVKNQITNNNEIQQLINEDGFVVEPIIKISNDTWNRDETEKMLEKKNYHYIVYVKLFHGKPWIVGKTGTKLVNQSGIDFDFKIYNPDNLDDTNYSGPGRTYAHRYYPDELYSDFDYVLCKNFDSEGDALIFEQFIAQKYNIFES